MNKRPRNHLALLATTVLTFSVASFFPGSASLMDTISITSAYLCLSFLGVIFVIGPLYAFRKGRSPNNLYLRRDLGIWAALNGLLHFYLANVLSMNTEYLSHYVENALLPPSAEVRSDLYMWGTIFGYVVAVLFVLLLSLSSDWAIKKVGAKRWKRLQKTGYLTFILTIIHAFFFQVLESRPVVWALVIFLVSALVLTFQVGRYWVIKRKK